MSKVIIQVNESGYPELDQYLPFQAWALVTAKGPLAYGIKGAFLNVFTGDKTFTPDKRYYFSAHRVTVLMPKPQAAAARLQTTGATQSIGPQVGAGAAQSAAGSIQVLKPGVDELVIEIHSDDGYTALDQHLPITVLAKPIGKCFDVSASELIRATGDTKWHSMSFCFTEHSVHVLSKRNTFTVQTAGAAPSAPDWFKSSVDKLTDHTYSDDPYAGDKTPEAVDEGNTIQIGEDKFDLDMLRDTKSWGL